MTEKRGDSYSSLGPRPNQPQHGSLLVKATHALDKRSGNETTGTYTCTCTWRRDENERDRRFLQLLAQHTEQTYVFALTARMYEETDKNAV